VKERHELELMSVSEVAGVGVSKDPLGRDVITVYLTRDSEQARSAIPKAIEGVPVDVRVVGDIVAQE
jgi:hypothetical protein